MRFVIQKCKYCQHKHTHNANIIEPSDEEASKNEYEIEDFALITTQNPKKNFVTEMKISAIIDTASTKTVADKEWLRSYLKIYMILGLIKLKFLKDTKHFKFGDGHIAISQSRIPTQIGNNKCFIKMEIVKENIPLLLSKTPLKKAGTVLNIRNDKILIFNKDINISTSASGHYAISILPDETCKFDDIKEVWIFQQDENDDSKFRRLLNSAKKFGHASANNLENLFQQAGLLISDKSDMINKVFIHSNTCKLYKKTFTMTSVGLSKTMSFNDTVTMNPHQLGQRLWYLQVIDEFSRFSNATIIKSKDPNLVINMFLKHRISLFGSPKNVFRGNG